MLFDLTNEKRKKKGGNRKKKGFNTFRQILLFLLFSGSRLPGVCVADVNHFKKVLTPRVDKSARGFSIWAAGGNAPAFCL